MKTINRNSIIAIALFLFLWTVQPASALYAPSAQRWVNRDPIGEKGGLNLFGFVANQPISKSDKDGRIVPVLIIVGGVAIIASGCGKAPPPPPPDFHPGAPPCPNATNYKIPGYTRQCGWQLNPNTGEWCVSVYCTPEGGPGEMPPTSPPSTPPAPPKYDSCFTNSKNPADCAACIIAIEGRISYDTAYKMCEQRMPKP
jgi:hypothetical protein